MRAPLLLALLCAACAFPPNAGFEEPDLCDDACAGRCANGECVPAALGQPCDRSGFGTACVSGAECVDDVCVSRSCEGDPCLCPGAPRCAGRCSQGLCLAADPGERCDPSGFGPTCSAGTCLNEVCTLEAAPVPLGTWRERYAGAYCQWLARCSYWPDALMDRCPDTIATSAPLFGSIAANVRLAETGALAYDADLAGDCLSGLSARDCLGAPPASCARVFSGSGAPGDACQTDESCAADAWCYRADPSGLSCGGVCEPRPLAGESCTFAPCADGLVCVEEDVSEVCRLRDPPGTFGKPCQQAPGSCGPGLFCDPDLKRCLNRRNEGDLCDHWNGCVDGLVCAFVSSTRAECLPARRIGESCRSHQQCAPAVALIADAQCLNGRCAALPSFGSCGADTFTPNRCDPEVAFCDVDEQCRPLRALDDGCSSEASCGAFGDAVCSFGACRLPHACE